ncbi:MAG: PilZ domain-containing protein [Acidobacteria bacterium]|nr:PilZ domain-containing protein [Acidobacteriota bacterium]MBV9146648.1 PilZ domain-containing protein [Acidobacteriota bacterium]MBV9435621.1 PilZ domain-containing protein [Acidobacteriota bacterium]
MIGSPNYGLLMMDRRKTLTTSALERRKRNRRAYPRWIFDFEVRLHWANRSVDCRGYEIGAGGLSFLTDEDIPGEMEIEVEYRLSPETDPVSVKGVVRHVEGKRYGVEFLNLGMKDRLALVEYCEKIKPV